MLQDFFKRVYSPQTQLQYGEVNAIKPLKKFNEFRKYLEKNSTRNLYFLAGVNLNKQGRASDLDVIKKSYIAFDFDVRQEYSRNGHELTEAELQLIAIKIQETLSKSSAFKDYGAIIFTGNGYHIYFFSEPLSMTGKVEEYAAGYKIIAEQLSKELGLEYDASCSNLARLMRIPGSVNNKYGKQTEVQIVDFRDKDSDILKKVLSLGVGAETPRKSNSIKRLPGENVFWEFLSRQDNLMMLNLLSGSKLVDGEMFTFRPRPRGGFYIDVNNKPADAWIAADGHIGSGKGGGPTWIQWVEYYGKTKREIALWAKGRLSELLGQEKVKVKPVSESEDDEKVNSYSSERLSDLGMQMLEKKSSGLTWGVDSLDKSFGCLDNGDYIVMVGESSAGKTAFSLQMAFENAARGRKVLYLSFESSAAKVLARRAKNFAGITKEEWNTKIVPEHKKSSYKEALIIPESLHLKDLKQGSEPNPDDIEKYLKNGSYDLVFIDNFGFLNAGEKEEWNDLKKISKSFVWLSNTYETAIVALHHFNKGTGKRTKPRGLSSIRGTAKIENDVDWMIQVWRQTEPAAYKKLTDEERRETTIQCLKDREGGNFEEEIVHYRDGLFQDDPDKYLPL